MSTPTQSKAQRGAARRIASLLWRGLRLLARLSWRGLVALGRAAGKFVATVWRLAGALDAALWRGAKLAGGALWRALKVLARVGATGVRELMLWLPTRAGRAYSAFSGVVLIVALLWIADFIRAKDAATVGSAVERRAPIDLQDPILARIDGRYVHLSEVAAAARAAGALRDDETLTPEAAFSRRLVETYVEQRLLARAALDEGLHRQPQAARQLAAARERLLAAAYLQARLDASVSDAAVERLYNAQSDVTRLGDEVRARHIVVDTGEAAAAVVAALDAGGDFSVLARQLSQDRATATLGGDLDWFTRDMMIPALAEAAFSTPVGERAPPFQTEFGWHVLEVLDRRRTNGVPLSAVRDNIRRFLTMRTIERTLSQLKEASDVVYYPADPARAVPAAQAAPETDDEPEGVGADALRDPPLPPDGTGGGR